MTENKYPDYQDDHDLAPLCCIFVVAVGLLMLGIVPNTHTTADPCTLQNHELMVIDRGVDNLVLEVPRDYCDYKKSPVEEHRTQPSSHQQTGDRMARQGDLGDQRRGEILHRQEDLRVRACQRKE